MSVSGARGGEAPHLAASGEMTLEIAQDFQPAPLALFPERQCLAHGLFFVLDSAALDSPLNEFALVGGQVDGHTHRRHLGFVPGTDHRLAAWSGLYQRSQVAEDTPRSYGIRDHGTGAFGTRDTVIGP